MTLRLLGNRLSVVLVPGSIGAVAASAGPAGVLVATAALVGVGRGMGQTMIRALSACARAELDFPIRSNRCARSLSRHGSSLAPTVSCHMRHEN